MASLAVALAFAPPAAASGHANRPFASLPHLGPAPQRCELGTDPNCPEFTQGTNFTVESTCGAINISPHVVNVGQNVTATLLETPRNCRVQWGAPPDRKVAGCRDGVYKEINPQDVQTIVPPSGTCVWKATQASFYPPDAKAPGGGWDQFEVGFCAFVGCAALASDYYYVLPHKKAISGTVYSNAVDAVGNRVGLANAVIKLSGASSGTAVTNKDGFYDALVDPGRYTVRVASINGQSVSATPIACSPGSASGTDCKLDVGGHDGVADFSSCGASGPAGDVARAAAAGGASPCGLTVKVQVLGPVRSGLAVHRHPYADFPVDFAIHKAGALAVTQCQSGCADVVVTVTDQKAHKTVPGAQVKASLGAIAHVVSGEQSLCGPFGACGTVISGQTTDANGQVHLIYWVPGVIEQTSVNLRVTATLTCSPTSCPARKKQGVGTKSLTVKPYLIYQHSADLDAHEAFLLAEWSHGTSFFTKFLKATPWAEKVVEFSAGALEGAEVEAEVVTKALAAIEVAESVTGPVIAAVELFNTFTELSEREEMIALFLEKNDLSAVGLGRAPFEASASPTPSFAFENQLANFGTAAPGNLFAGGLLWRYAETLAYLRAHHDRAFGSQKTELKIYEISHCDQAHGSCEPGYGNTVGTSIVLNPGIQPELYFEFSAEHDRFHHSFGPTSFTIPYDAIAWTETQTPPKQGPLLGLFR